MYFFNNSLTTHIDYKSLAMKITMQHDTRREHRVASNKFRLKIRQRPPHVSKHSNRLAEKNITATKMTPLSQYMYRNVEYTLTTAGVMYNTTMSSDGSLFWQKDW